MGYSYDENGLCIESLYKSYYQGEIDYASKYKYTYNEQGLVSQFSLYSMLVDESTGESWYLGGVGHYTYDVNGNCTLEEDEYFDPDGQTNSKSSVETTYTNDGQVAEIIKTDESNYFKLTSKEVYEYDSEGIILNHFLYYMNQDEWLLSSSRHYQWGAAEPQTNLVECVYLVGAPSGWMWPVSENTEQYEPWKLRLVKDNYGFYGEFDVAPGDAMFRIYTELNGWEEDSWGSQVEDSPVDFEIDPIFNFPMKPGKGSFNFPDWPGGKMYVYVAAGSDYLMLQVQAEPMGYEVDGIANVVVSPSTGPSEYFNLQGVKIENPQHGQFYIHRQGSKVTKIIY